MGFGRPTHRAFSRGTCKRSVRELASNSLEVTHRVLLRKEVVWASGHGPTVDQVPLLPSTLAIAVMVFQLRVVTGTPKSRSIVPR